MEDRWTIASACDSALDPDAMSVVGYARSRDNDTLAIKEGKEPTWFDFRLLGRKEFKWVKAGADADEQAERAFQIGVTLIRNLHTDPPRQVIGEYRREGHVVIQGLGRVDAYSEDQLARVPLDYILDVGACVFARAFLARESVISYPVPPRLLAVWGAIGSPRAEEKPQSSESADSTTP